MYGIVTRSPADLVDETFDLGFVEVKDVTGRRSAPAEDGVNMVSCHGDSSVTDDMVPVDGVGRRATRERRYFDWGYVCPTHPGYRGELLELIDTCVDANEDLRLDDVGFPRQGYCRCDRCEARFAASDLENRTAWRASVITDFVADVRDIVPGRLYLTLYPDPYPGHLRRRSGLDPAAVSSYVDEFVVPLYDMAYATTYWLEVIASGFVDALDRPFSVELYAVQVELDNLVHAGEVVRAYAKDVCFAYDTDNARDAVERLREE